MHHWLGLSFGLVTWTWLFSGVLSLHPFDWSSGTAVTPVRANFIQALPTQAQLTATPPEVIALCQASGLVVRELELRMVLDSPTYFCHHAAGTRPVPAEGSFTEPSAAAIAGHLEHSESAAVSVRRVTQSDSYFYSSLHGGQVPDAFRAELNNGGTLYVSAVDSQPLRLYGNDSKAERWLYHGLHSFDVSWLRSRQWLRLSLMLLLLTGGLMLCATGIVGFARWANRSKER